VACRLCLLLLLLSTQVVVDVVDPGVLVSSCATHVLDFTTCTEQQLQDFTIPLNLQVWLRVNQGNHLFLVVCGWVVRAARMSIHVLPEMFKYSAACSCPTRTDGVWPRQKLSSQ
jgi:hypothetical protein